MSSYESGCPICLREDATLKLIPSAIPPRIGEIEDRTHQDNGYFVICPMCGEFVVTRMDNVNFRSPRLRSAWHDFQISALLYEQTTRPPPRFWLRYGMNPYGALEKTDLVPIELDELLTRWPRTVVERIERTLCNLARLSPVAGHHLTAPSMEKSVAFAETLDEAKYNIKAIVDAGFLEVIHKVSGILAVVSLTPRGWARFEALTQGASGRESRVRSDVVRRHR